MNDIIDIDEIMQTDDNNMDIAYSSEHFISCQQQDPIKYAPHEESSAIDANTRCISIESDDSTNSTANLSIQSQSSISIAVQGHADDIFDEYDILPTILGTGGYGCVRECLHRATGEKFAVKTIDKSKVSRLDHIQREVELLRTVDHPGIMKMVDCFENRDYVHIITEMCTGGELFDRIVENTNDFGCLPEDEAVEIIKSLLESVDYLHENDIVHRDIKPENVLFESNEKGASVKLIDFGLSRRHGVNDGHMTNGVGTTYYMSPGVLQGKYDRSCDLWAIGVVSYILLTGYPPFNGDTDHDIHDSTMQGNLVFEGDVWVNLSNSSRDFVSKLLCKDSSSRISSAKEALSHSWVSSA